MSLYNQNTIQLTNYGRESCSNMHFWGPGARPCYIIHYVIKGAGYLECGGRRYHILAGESFLIFPYVIVHYYPDPEDPWEYTWVDFIGKEVPDYLQYCAMNRKHPVCPSSGCENILSLFERLKGMDIYTDNRNEASGILLSILGLYADAFPASDDTLPTQEDNRLDTAMTLIRSNYHYPHFNIEELCRLMHCNRVTLYRLFQNGLQFSPSHYLCRYRISQACQMLQLNMSVKTTAISCGFTDQFYFSRAFKQLTGVSPSGYRKIDEHRQLLLAYELLNGVSKSLGEGCDQKHLLCFANGAE